MSRFWIIVISTVAVALLCACEPVEGGYEYDGDDSSEYDSTGGAGIVMNPSNGRTGIGIDMGGGLYLNPATGGIGIGIPLS